MKDVSHVIMASRNRKLAQVAKDKLENKDKIEIRELDISIDGSIDSFVHSFKKDYDHLDILINNAGVAFKNSDPTLFKNQARPTFNTKFFGTVNLTEQLIPLLNKAKSPKIINVASESGHLKIFPNKEHKDFLQSEKLALTELKDFANDFITNIENETNLEYWPKTCYGTSKACLIAYTKILARNYPNIISNCYCPGYCSTSMTSHKGHRSAEKGAETAIYLISEVSKSGDFYSDKEIIEW